SPTDRVEGQYYPWGWEKPEFDDTHWSEAKWVDIAGETETQFAGGIMYSNGKSLTSRQVALLYERPEPLGKIVKIEGASKNESFLHNNGKWIIPANSKVQLLIDREYQTIGYPEMNVSGGKNSEIKVMYAENLIYKNKASKGDRNDIRNKYMVGIKDYYYTDGGSNRTYRPTYLRSFRYIQLDIKTAEEQLEIHSFKNILCTAPLELKTKFECDNKLLNAIYENGWRTARICAQDILMSDAYYEQLQYTGDSRVHNLTLLTLSNDDLLTRNFLTQIDQSRIPEGLTLAAYPNAFHLVIPSYSLIWIDQVYDYMIWKDDKEFISKFDLGIRSVIDWYEKRLQPNGLLGPIPWWPALAWPRNYKNGVPMDVQKGNNTLYSLHFAYTLKHASEIYKNLGKSYEATRLYQMAEKINTSVNTSCKNKDGFYTESPSLDSVSQITNIMAVVSGAVKETEARIFLKKLLEQKIEYGQVDLFLHLYLFEALNMTGLETYFINELSEWELMQKRNMTTFAEVPLEWGEENQRSECHPWSTIPNYHLFRTICGIQPTSAGYRTIQIKPELSHLNFLKAEFPLQDKVIKIDIKKIAGVWKGTLYIPQGIQAEAIYGAQKQKLSAGDNSVIWKAQ
ncbi:MAG: hypothetical protein ACRCVT_03125, partial [Leadbetterella sp.]